MPNARRDVDRGASRPLLRSSAAARIAILGLGGEVLADTVATEAEIPPAGERIAVLDPGAASDAGLLGWHAGQRLAYVGWGTALVAGGTLHLPGGGVTPHRQRARAGWVEAAELTASAPMAETRFVDPVRALAVAVDRDGSDGKPQLDLLLSGASQTGDDGIPLAVGARTYLLYSIEPQGGGPVTVTVAHQQGRPLGGVLASVSAGAEEIAQRLSEDPLDSLLRPLAVAPAGREQQLSLEWIGGPDDPRPRRDER